MKYILVFLMTQTICVFAGLQEDVEKMYSDTLLRHHEWASNHKHEDVDAWYYYRIGYMDACVKILDLMHENPTEGN